MQQFVLEDTLFGPDIEFVRHDKQSKIRLFVAGMVTIGVPPDFRLKLEAAYKEALQYLDPHSEPIAVTVSDIGYEHTLYLKHFGDDICLEWNNGQDMDLDFAGTYTPEDIARLLEWLKRR